MEVTRTDGNHMQFKLGLAERWVIAGAFALSTFLLGYVFHTFDLRLEHQAESMQGVLTGQAVTNAQLIVLSQQLSDVPALTRDMAELKGQVNRNSTDIRDLQQMRHLR